MSLPRRDGPFAWSPERPDISHVDLLVVREAYRGRGLAPRLLRRLSEEMGKQGVTLIEAHIDADNYPSLQAFLKAGWDVSRTAGGDFYVCCRPALGCTAQGETDPFPELP